MANENTISRTELLHAVPAFGFAEVVHALQGAAAPFEKSLFHQLLDAVFADASEQGMVGDKEQAKLSETRYGLGTGIKFSLVTMDVTAGYSWNLRKRPGESRGAFVFALDISDLFR